MVDYLRCVPHRGLLGAPRICFGVYTAQTDRIARCNRLRIGVVCAIIDRNNLPCPMRRGCK